MLYVRMSVCLHVCIHVDDEDDGDDNGDGSDDGDGHGATWAPPPSAAGLLILIMAIMLVGD